MLRAQDVKKNFISGTEKLEILCGVSLAIEKPESVSIMGRSGCGKSTFISLLAGLDSASAGSIEILGQNLDAFRAGDLNRFRARHIGIIFQQFHLLDHLTALENVRLPLDLNRTGKGHGQVNPDDLALDMLARVGLSHRADFFPETMSRGEQQRIAIARVLVMKPEVLLADEPTGSLDIKTGAEVVELLFALTSTQNMALVMATHDPALAARCDRHYSMNEGRLLPGLLT